MTGYHRKSAIRALSRSSRARNVAKVGRLKKYNGGFIETLTGRGSVLVASGIGVRHKVRMGEIDDPGPVAATLRELVP